MTGRTTSRHGPHAIVRAAALAALSAWLSGCLVAWGVLEPDGSGMLELTYTAGEQATEESEAMLFRSPHLTIQSLTIGQGRRTVVRLAFDDVTALPTGAWFRGATITRTRDGREEHLHVAVDHERWDVAEEGRPGPRISMTLPGRIVEANEPAEVTRNRVVWSYTLAEFLAKTRIPLDVRYVADDAPPFVTERRGLLRFPAVAARRWAAPGTLQIATREE